LLLGSSVTLFTKKKEPPEKHKQEGKKRQVKAEESTNSPFFLAWLFFVQDFWQIDRNEK
jgi:hypothetical protein